MTVLSTLIQLHGELYAQGCHMSYGTVTIELPPADTEAFKSAVHRDFLQLMQDSRSINHEHRTFVSFKLQGTSYEIISRRETEPDTVMIGWAMHKLATSEEGLKRWPEAIQYNAKREWFIENVEKELNARISRRRLTTAVHQVFDHMRAHYTSQRSEDET